MFRKIKKKLFKRNRQEIAPDEIFLDSSNLPDFNRDQFEGRLEKPIAGRTLIFVGTLFIIVGVIFSYRIWNLQIAQGKVFAKRSENNRLRHTLIFSDRGVIFDRNEELLAWNEDNPHDSDFSFRRYSTTTGISNLLGYIKYPSKDSAGFYYREDYEGVDGVEKFFNEQLKGENGIKITETNAFGKVESQSVMEPPQNGENLRLSIDSRIQSQAYNIIRQTALEYGFAGGVAIIMDVETGEILTQVTYPEYDSQVFSDGSDRAKIQGFLTDQAKPLLDRATSGLYVPGSIIKPFVALGALNERVVTADTVIHTTGSISVQNPYNPDEKTIFRDWKNHGSVDIRKAIEQSSDVYFYEVGGGFGNQKGIGISNIEKYVRMFGFGHEVDSPFFGLNVGVVPNPEWKLKTFNGDAWRLGNTYHTAIGQYGFQVTPIQVVRAYAAIANYGKLVSPTIIAGDTSMQKNTKQIELPKYYFDIIHDGMRPAAVQGTAVALNIPSVQIAAKTGTAELGISKEYVNSWTTGFFPYKKPRYAFAVLMEKGHRSNLVGAAYVSRQIFDWMTYNTPEYLEEKQ